MVSGCVGRYPDEEAGEVPMAFIAKKPTNNITAKDVIEFVGRQVIDWLFQVLISGVMWILVYLGTCVFCM